MPLDGATTKFRLKYRIGADVVAAETRSRKNPVTVNVIRAALETDIKDMNY